MECPTQTHVCLKREPQLSNIKLMISMEPLQVWCSHLPLDYIRELMGRWVLQELADRGQAIGLNIPQLASLRDCLAALHWATRARALLASTELDPRPAAPAQAAAQPQAAPAEQGAAQPAAPAELHAVAGSGPPGGSAPAQDPAPAPLQLRLVGAGPPAHHDQTV